MKTAQKISVLFLSLVYILSLMYVSTPFRAPVQDKNPLSQSAKAQQSDLYTPQFERTLTVYSNPTTTPLVDWVGGAHSQDRYTGFEKIGELTDNSGNKKVIAIGYGRLWEYQNTSSGNDWVAKAWYAPVGCVAEEVNIIAAEFYKNHIFIIRYGFGACGENFNYHILNVYGYINNTLSLTYTSTSVKDNPCGDNLENLNDVERNSGVYLNADNKTTCVFGYRQHGKLYRPSMTVAGDILYLGFFRPPASWDEANDDSDNQNTSFLVRVSGFEYNTPNTPNTPKMDILCRFSDKCKKIHHLIGSQSGKLYAFEQRFTSGSAEVINTLVELTPVALGTPFNIFSTVIERLSYSDIPNSDRPISFSIPNGSGSKGAVFTVFDSISSYGKLFFAVGLYKGDIPNCPPPSESIRQIIVSFDLNNHSNYQLFDLGSRIHGSSQIPTGRCNKSPEIAPNGYIFNGGGFVEITKNNTKKLLYGYTFCKVGRSRDSGLTSRYFGLIICSDGTSGAALIQYRGNSNWEKIDMRGAEKAFRDRYSDVRVISMYYSPSYGKLFAGIRNRDKVFNEAAPPNIVHHPGLWVDNLEPPITDKCISLQIYDSNNSTTNSISPNNPNITIVNSGTAIDPQGQGYVDIIHNNNVYARKSANGQPANNGQSGAYTMTVSFNLNDLSGLRNSGASVAQVRVAIPGTNTYANEPSCILYLYITPYENPRVNGTVRGSCTDGERLNPYKLTFVMDALPSNAPNARVNKVTVTLKPQGVCNSPGGCNIVVDSMSTTASNPNDYVIVNKELRQVENNIARFTFTIRFNPDNDYYYQNYIRTQTLRYEAYVRDTSGRTNQGDPNGSGTIIINPLDDCASLYYKTGNGDVRSYEPREVDGTRNFNRILRVTSDQGINNLDKFDGKVSDYLYEGPYDIDQLLCSKLTRAGVNFCQKVNNNTQSRLNQFLQKLNQLMDDSSIQSYTIDGNSNYPWVGVVNSILNIYVYQISEARQKTVIVKITGGLSRVRIYDQVNNTPNQVNNTPNNVIIWCAVEDCKMEIAPVGSIESINVDVNNQVLYTVGDNLKNYLLNKSRLYINTGASGETRLYSYPNSSKKVHIYSGGIITNGYFYTNTSYKTNIVKGFVYTRGVVASGNAQGSVGGSNSNNNRNSNRYIYFRDFFDEAYKQPKPFLYIDYDPKYLFNFKDLFVRDPETVRKNIVGL